jgi:hypothetical protein
MMNDQWTTNGRLTPDDPLMPDDQSMPGGTLKVDEFPQAVV